MLRQTEKQDISPEVVAAVAVALGRKGGLARARNLDAPRLRKIALMGVKARLANAAKRRREK